MGERTTDGGGESEPTDDARTRCLVCEAPIATDGDARGFRVVPAVEDGATVHRRLCSDDCVERWRAERGRGGA